MGAEATLSLASTEGWQVTIPGLQNLICQFPGHRVMLDAQLADLYGLETEALVQAVKLHHS